MDVLGVLSVIAGLALLVLLTVDIFVTVFVPRGRAGPVTHRMYLHCWRAWRAVAGRGGGSRRHLLALAGPVLLPLTVAVWVAGLVGGFTLVYLPFIGAFPASASAGSPFVTALYFSGVSATTLGVGDVYADSTALRLLSVTEAAMGFAVFSASITYLLSVFNALRRSTSLALEVSTYLHAPQGDVVESLAVMLREDQADELSQWFVSVTSRLVETTQAQEQYPVLDYFHVPDDDRALPLALADLLDVLTACQAVLDPGAHPCLAASQRAKFALATATDDVSRRAKQVPSLRDPQELARVRLALYHRVRDCLGASGARLRPEAEARNRFVTLRERWDGPDAALADHYAYPHRVRR